MINTVLIVMDFLLPMDEALVEIALDLSGRNYCSFEANFDREMVGDLSVELVKHFFCIFFRRSKGNTTYQSNRRKYSSYDRGVF